MQVLGAPDERMGEIPVAFVVRKAGTTPSHLSESEVKDFIKVPVDQVVLR